MEEKKYHIDESKVAGDKVCEPSPAYASVASESVSHHVIDSGIEQEDEIPVLKNHFSDIYYTLEPDYAGTKCEEIALEMTY